MRSNHWSSLLAGCSSPTGLAALASAIGFGTAAALDQQAATAIGLPDQLTAAHVAGGPGTTRMLLLTSTDAGPVRNQVRSIATRLTSRAPHLLWLLAIADPLRGELAIAAWQGGSGPPRLAALVVQVGHILPSDAETLAALADAMDAGDLVIHARWIEVLGREAISRRFFITLEQLVNRLADGSTGRATAEERRELALLHVSRMLFLSFLETRQWLDGDRRFLSRTYDECLERGGGYQQRVLAPLFFGTLNTPLVRRAAAARALGRIPFLNGGLFTRAAVEVRRRHVVQSDDDWGAVHDELLLRYRFTGREESGDWREAAVDPEMLGRAFESLMAARERRASGAYFTPVALVERTADTALESLLAARGIPDGTLARAVEGVALEPPLSAALGRAVDALRLLDPACGSGAFLVHALERLTLLRRAAGDARPVSQVRRDVVARSIFGVDVNPTAVWLCELRLWLALVIDHADDDPGRLPPLPNLDHNIRCGDALDGGDFSLPGRRDLGGESARLRTRYVRATGARKRTLGRALDRLERSSLLAWYDARIEAAVARRRDLVLAARGRDLFGARRGSVGAESAALRDARNLVRDLRARRQRVAGGGALPFAFAAHFPDAAVQGGFDLVVGNPPWVRVHNIPRPDRERWRREFRVFRDAAWADGAATARAGAGFAAQVDVASLFVERGLALLQPGGVLSFLVPSKLWQSLAGGGVRRLVTSDARLLALEDWSDAPPAFDAATYPSIVALMRPPKAPDTAPVNCRLGVHHGRVQVLWHAPRESLPLDETPGAPWIALPPDARTAFGRLSRAGVPLAHARLGTVTLGVKSGCNAAYLVRQLGAIGDDREVTDGTRIGRLPGSCVRPVLRGDAVRAWRPEPSAWRIVFPHDAAGNPVTPLPPAVRAWLSPWRARLETRSDARSARAWWSLFRLEGARCDHPRVAWADIGRSLQAVVLEAGDPTVPINSCYVLATPDRTDALALAALLNSAVANAWLRSVCEPARGGFRRHMAWSVARLPVPDDWARARDLLAPLGERGLAGGDVGRGEILDRTLDAFRLRHASVAALLAWTSR